MTEPQHHTITIKEGWKGKFVGGQLLLVHPDGPAYLIDMRSVQGGDVLPRETDKPIVFDL